VFERLDSRSPTPLYAQISTRLRVAIAAGELRPGESLPSVRQLASQLRINPATVVQAYRALEAEGLVATRQGAGTFVLDVPANRRSTERAEEARRLVRDLIADAGRLGIPVDELRQAVDHELNGRKE
jgi:GntR family transcriptional regulator